MVESISGHMQVFLTGEQDVACFRSIGKRQPRINVVSLSIRASKSRRSFWLSGKWRKPALASSLISEARNSYRCGVQRNDIPSDLQEEEEYATWQKVKLMERLLGVAVLDENYTEAARLRDVLCKLKAQLTTTEHLLLMNTKALKDEDPYKRIQAIEALGDIGDKRVFPVLSDGLRDGNQRVVVETEKAMWKIFMRSGREDVDKCIQEGVSKMVAKDGLAAARDIFSEVIEMAPSFAEGYNKRATVNYLLQDYHKSIEDCHKTLKLNPYHFAALSGLGLCYVALEDPESALCWLEKAYAMHPGLAQISKYIKVLKKKIKEKQSKAGE